MKNLRHFLESDSQEFATGTHPYTQTATSHAVKDPFEYYSSISA